MELPDGSFICVACEAAEADERLERGDDPRTLVVEGLAVAGDVDHEELADILRPVTIRFPTRERERARVLAKAQGIPSYQTYIKKLVKEGMDRDEERLFPKPASAAPAAFGAQPTAKESPRPERARPMGRTGQPPVGRTRGMTGGPGVQARAATTKKDQEHPSEENPGKSKKHPSK